MTANAPRRNERSAAKRTEELSDSPQRSNRKANKPSDDNDFAAELAGASLQVQQQQQVRPQAGGQESGTPAQAGGVQLTARDQGALSAEAATAGLSDGKVNLQGAAQTGKTTSSAQMSATSPNTDAVFAGLKPWSREWVVGNETVKQLFAQQAQEAQVNQFSPEMARLTRPQSSMGGGTEAISAETPLSIAQATGLQGDFAENVAVAELGISESDFTVGDVRDQRGGKPAWNQAGLQPAGAELIANPGAQSPRPAKLGSISGSDFLGTLDAVRNNQGLSEISPRLKVIEGGARERKSEAEDVLMKSSVLPEAAANGLKQAGGGEFSLQAPAREITGHVTQGAMAQERLSSETLTGLTSGIRGFTAQGGGEIRLRLRPENLGELHVRVVTRGDQVGLQIQASDDKAKRIIEESMSHLKDSLAGQHLSLGRVDVTIAHSVGGSADSRADLSQQNQNGQNALFFGQDGQSNPGQRDGWAQQDRFAQESGGTLRPAASRSAQGMGFVTAAGQANRMSAGSGRLDVRA